MTRYRITDARGATVALVDAAQARARGMWTHLARVNTPRRITYAAAHLYDSADGTGLAFTGTTGARELCAALDFVNVAA